MPNSTLAGIITALASGFTAISLIITAVTGLIAVRKTHRKLNEVHKIVNQQQTDLRNYQNALIRALQAADIEVPIDQSDGGS